LRKNNISYNYLLKRLSTSIKIIVLIISIVIIFFITGCDLQKLWGYEYESDPTPESAKIYGKVTDIFTGEPIKDVLVTVNNSMTVTDENGNYILYYRYIQDEDRNVPVPTKYTQQHYLQIDSSMVVFPINEINVSLAYASPIIQKICMVDSVYICQAIIYDHQGFEDINSVVANLAYRIPGERYPSLYIKKEMTRVMTDSLNTCSYQVLAPDYFNEYGELMNIYEIYAEDRFGYSDLMSSNDPRASDSLLFPIVH